MNIVESFVNFCDNMQIATESGMDSKKSVKNNLAVTYEHMLKLKYRTKDQNNSWFRSILCFYEKVTDLQPSVFAKCIRDENIVSDAFDEGLYAAVHTKKANYTYDMFPSELPEDWNISNLLDLDFLERFILKYAADDKKIDAQGDIHDCKKYKKEIDRMRSKYVKYNR